MIHLVRERTTPQQIKPMLDVLGTSIKLAVDIRRKMLAGEGILHADCEAELLNDGSRQEDMRMHSYESGVQIGFQNHKKCNSKL